MYDEYLGAREFQEDEVNYDSDFPSPLDVDYIFFDAARDSYIANLLELGRQTVGTCCRQV